MRNVLLILFLTGWQLGICQPDCFWREPEPAELSETNKRFLDEIGSYYQPVPGDEAVHIIPYWKLRRSLEADTSYEQLRLLAYHPSIRVKALFLREFGSRCSDKHELETYFNCVVRDTTTVAQFDGCILYTTTFGEYAYNQLIECLSNDNRSAIETQLLHESHDPSLRYTLLQNVPHSDSGYTLLRSLVTEYHQSDVLEQLLQFGKMEDRLLLFDFLPDQYGLVHQLMMQFPHPAFQDYLMKEAQVLKERDERFSQNIFYLANVQDSTFQNRFYEAVCENIGDSEYFPNAGFVYRSFYVSQLPESERSQLLLDLIPSLQHIDSTDIALLNQKHKSGFDAAVSKRLSTSTEAFDLLTAGWIFPLYATPWTDEKLRACLRVCGQSYGPELIEAIVLLKRHPDARLPEILRERFFMLEESEADEYHLEWNKVIEAICFLDDTLAYAAISDQLLSRYAYCASVYDRFCYLHILDLSGKREQLFQQVEQHLESFCDTEIFRFLLEKYDPLINERLTRIYAQHQSANPENSYLKEVKEYLLFYGVMEEH